LSDSHSLNARKPRVSWRPRSVKFDLAVAGGDVEQELAVGGEDRLQQGDVADQHAAGLQRLEQPLVGVEGERVGLLDPGQQPAAAGVLGQAEQLPQPAEGSQLGRGHPEAACQVPANTPKPEARASASMPT
jgi:hypothetical protein